MNAGLPGIVVLVPLLAALAAALLPAVAAWWCAIAGTAATFLLAAALLWAPATGLGLLADPLAIHMAVLTAFVAMTGVWCARPLRRLESAGARRGPALHCALLAALLLALLADDVVLGWAGLAAAVLLLVAGLRSAGGAAAWSLFLAGGAALALVLLGVLFLSLAALPVLGTGEAALRWTQLADAAPHAPASLLTLAFVFLLLGYGTLAGLVPLHGALAAATAAGPVPLTGLFGTLLPGVALVTLLRARALLAANPQAVPPGPALLALGLLSLLLAALALCRRGSASRVPAIAGTGQIGVVAFAFGLGTGAAIFAGLLHLTLLTLLRAALAQGLVRAVQLKGGEGLGGLLAQHRALGLTLAALLVALAGLPPFGLFTSGFLIVMETMRQAPLLALPLGLGLAVVAWALAGRVVALCRHAPVPDAGPAPPPAALLPAWLHLAIVLGLGLAMPGAVVAWLAGIAETFR